MKYPFALTLLCMVSPFSHAESMLQDPCKLPIEHSNSHLCKDIGQRFNSEQSKWQEDKEEPNLTLDFWDGTRAASDNEWQKMDIEDKVLYEKRNECARNDEVECVIFDND